MVTKFKDIFSSVNLKVFLIFLLALFFFGSGVILSYVFLNGLLFNQGLVEFEDELKTMIDRQRRAEVEVQLPTDLKELSTRKNNLASIDYELNNRNPFKIEEVKKVKEIEDRESDGKENIELDRRVEVIGILGAETDRKAILEVSGSSYIVDQGFEVEWLKVKSITAKEVIILQDGQQVTYRLGGEED
ncbi:hypothetical protein [Natroniella sp. ANB-PHB2]|uniref:hypothetical protein n=1 Tax=Natroniella sp. ANB-PHB2 TaxID=3384444 RepID=UPI0038D3B92F